MLSWCHEIVKIWKIAKQFPWQRIRPIQFENNLLPIYHLPYPYEVICLPLTLPWALLIPILSVIRVNFIFLKQIYYIFQACICHSIFDLFDVKENIQLFLPTFSCTIKMLNFIGNYVAGIDTLWAQFNKYTTQF